MLARLQRLAVLCVILATLTWWVVTGLMAWALPWRLFGLVLIAMPHAAVLALQFGLLKAFGRAAPAATPNLGQLLRAWCAEVQSGIKVFGWRQPFRSEVEPDCVDARQHVGRRGVVLVHGFVCNRGLWTPWLRELRAAGVPFVAVNLEPVFASIDDYTPIVDAAVLQLERATGVAPVVVAHSMGGLVVRAWLACYDADARTAGVITLGAPHAGTWLARFGLSRNARQMRQGSPWIAALQASEDAARRARFVCFYSHCDNIVFPAVNATLPDADNRHVPGAAHIHMLDARPPLAAMMKALAQ